MGKIYNNPFDCAVTATVQIIGGRWKIIILWCLQGDPIRFSKIAEFIPAISRKVLTQQLRELEEDGMVLREAYAEIPPRVEYSLTDKGKALLPILGKMCEWGKQYVLPDEAYQKGQQKLTTTPT